MTKGRLVGLLLFKSIRNFFLLFGLYSLILAFGPIAYFEVQYRVLQVEHAASFITDPIAHMRRGEYFASDFASSDSHYPALTPVSNLFAIMIPKIGANSVVTANVDSSNPSVYLPILQHSVAHAAGTSLPGEQGTIYLFAHSTDNWWDVGRYNAVFYLLKDLERGDSVQLMYQGKKYSYSVAQTKIVAPSDVSYLVSSKKSENRLILQTCWPPGTTWKRLLVIAKPE